MIWTRRDDEMIMANSNGWMSLTMLERKLGRSYRDISLRAAELGVTLYHQPKVRPNRHRKVEHPRPIDQENFSCVTGADDPLLLRLKLFHANKVK